LVIRGADGELPRDRETGVETHTLPVVLGTMMAQICMDYSGLPDVRTLTMSDIVWFYDGLRAGLKRATKPKDD